MVGVNFRPLSALGSQATSAAATFDLDGTVASNTVSAFFRHYGFYPPRDPDVARHFTETDPTSVEGLPPYFAWLEGARWPLERFQALRQTEPQFRSLLDEYTCRNHAGTIYPRLAEELAHARACLNTVVLITGTFWVFAAPVLPAIGADHVEVNEAFDERRIRGETKPDILIKLFREHRLWAYKVYTDDYSDRHMLIDPRLGKWQMVHIVPPGAVLRGEKPMDPELQGLIKKNQWTVLNRDLPNPAYPAAVKDYAESVIRGHDGVNCKRRFYSRWINLLKERYAAIGTFPQKPQMLEDSERIAWLNVVAGAGLYLKEPDEIKRVLVEAVDSEIDRICFELYQRLIQRDPNHTSPLELTTVPTLTE